VYLATVRDIKPNFFYFYLSSRARLQESLNEAIPVVSQIVTAAIGSFSTENTSQQGPTPATVDGLTSSLKCLEAWLQVFPARSVPVLLIFSDVCSHFTNSNLSPLLPSLVTLLNPSPRSNNDVPDFDETSFVAASDVLQEILSSSALSSNGAGSKTLTEPLLVWTEVWGQRIVQATVDCEYGY
jgi:hypothetical protein